MHTNKCKALILRGIFLLRKFEIEWFYQKGCDMIYPEHGKTHFYGRGSADPLRDDVSLQSLEAKATRLLIHAAKQGCSMVNLSKGKTRLTGAQELRIKESDRIQSMSDGFLNLNIKIEQFDDGMIIEGGKFSGGIINSNDDHRIAMAFAIAGIISKESIVINNCKNVATSFPNFISTAKEVGMNIDYV